MSAIDEAVRQFSRLPGVGPKTALRLVYHLLKSRSEDATRLSAAIAERTTFLGESSPRWTGLDRMT